MLFMIASSRQKPGILYVGKVTSQNLYLEPVATLDHQKLLNHSKKMSPVATKSKEETGKFMGKSVINI